MCLQCMQAQCLPAVQEEFVAVAAAVQEEFVAVAACPCPATITTTATATYYCHCYFELHTQCTHHHSLCIVSHVHTFIVSLPCHLHHPIQHLVQVLGDHHEVHPYKKAYYTIQHKIAQVYQTLYTIHL